MAEELSLQCSRLKLTDEETSVVDLGENIPSDVDAKVSLMLVGRLVTDRSFNLEAFKRTISMAWGVSKRIVIKALAANLFVFQFFHWRDKEKVLEGRPWCFDQHLLVLNEMSGNEQPIQVPLFFSPFWMRIYHLPFNCRSHDDICAITASLGTVLEVESSGLGLDNFCRVKLMLDIRKPLRRSQRIKGKDGNVISIDFKYERLPFFCFMCGIMGHSENDCLLLTDDDEDCSLGWGLWLKASPRKGRMKYLEEEAQILASRKLLFVGKNKESTSSSVEKVEGEGKLPSKGSAEDGAVDSDAESGAGVKAVQVVPAGTLGLEEVGGQKCEREVEGRSQEGVRECVGVVIDQQGGQGRVVDGVFNDVRPPEQHKEDKGKPQVVLTFSTGVCTSDPHKIKKGPRKIIKINHGKRGPMTSVAKGGKRKTWEEGICELDGFDVTMNDVELAGKRFKSDIACDGEAYPSTVAEVGNDQPREGQ